MKHFRLCFFELNHLTVLLFLSLGTGKSIFLKLRRVSIKKPAQLPAFLTHKED
ncbi:hypothetical protein HMPREF9554_00402 [Treponema phagedenis F0421]|nr:hypothetical protein HMPREF9554_00402 [Treponema phagedenis F0421]